jgi:hypothetical protein
MEQLVMTPLQQALDVIEQLPISDQEAVIEIVRQRLIERRRAEIAQHAADSIHAFREGRAHVGTVDDLRRHLLDES